MSQTCEIPPISTPVSDTAFDGVMFQLPLEDTGPPKPLPPSNIEDDENFIQLPSSPINKQTWTRVCEAYKRIPKTFAEFRMAICSYNEEVKSEGWNNFENLIEKIIPSEKRDHFFQVLLPRIVALALTLPEEVTRPVPLLKKHVTRSVTLSQKQIGVLLANAFLCTFSSRCVPFGSCGDGDFGEINFYRFFTRVYQHVTEQKWNSFMNYFERITESEPDGVVTFTRQYVQKEAMPCFTSSKKPLLGLQIENEGLIEEAKGHLLVDFADMYIGGFILTGGCVQEEILFLKYPELIISRLFTVVLDDSEALIITGAEQYNAGVGYGSRYKFAGNFQDVTSRDEFRRKKNIIVAIDALNLCGKREDQYTPKLMFREIEKAYAGFHPIQGTKGSLDPLATGNWGCGIFCGDVRLKSLLQLIAASEAGRNVTYFAFGEDQLVKDLGKLYPLLRRENVTVGELTSLLLSFADKLTKLDEKGKLCLYPYIKKEVKRKAGCSCI